MEKAEEFIQDIVNLNSTLGQSRANFYALQDGTGLGPSGVASVHMILNNLSHRIDLA